MDIENCVTEELVTAPFLDVEPADTKSVTPNSESTTEPRLLLGVESAVSTSGSKRKWKVGSATCIVCAKQKVLNGQDSFGYNRLSNPEKKLIDDNQCPCSSCRQARSVSSDSVTRQRNYMNHQRIIAAESRKQQADLYNRFVFVLCLLF
jgi:hypothetical protein